MRKELAVDSLSPFCLCSCGSVASECLVTMTDRHGKRDLKNLSSLRDSKTVVTCHGEMPWRIATCKEFPNQFPPRALHVPVLRRTSFSKPASLQSPSVKTIVGRDPSHEPRSYLSASAPRPSFARICASQEIQFSRPQPPVANEHSQGFSTLVHPFARRGSSELTLPRSNDRIYTGPDQNSRQIQNPAANKVYDRNTQLYKFLIDLLEDGSDHSCAIWIDRTRGIFRITDSTRLARLWGEIKLNPTMNYEKLARSFRHYYQKGILEGYSGGAGNGKQKLLYKFSRDVMETCVYNSCG